MGSKRCLACGDPLPLSSRVPDQSYCSRKACQRERRKLWQREKCRSDPVYRDNQAKAQKAWTACHADYWRQYREQHPMYVESNRTQQHARNASARVRPVIAKMDASSPTSPVPSGIYRLEFKNPAGIAKMDTFTVEITLLTTT